MFGAIVAGRLVDETHFVFPLDEPYAINHLTVFLTGAQPFPDGYGAGVHFQWPGKEYIALGVLTNSKPSAIYRVRPLLDSSSSFSAGGPSAPATLGIEIAPLQSLEALGLRASTQIVAAGATGGGSGPAGGAEGKGKELAGKVDVGKVAEKVVRNLFNYLHSFSSDAVKLTPDTPIPLSVFEKWYGNFTRKIENDRGASFLDRED